MSKTEKENLKDKDNRRVVTVLNVKQLDLDERQKSAFSELHKWEKRSGKKNFVLGQPSCYAK